MGGGGDAFVGDKKISTYSINSQLISTQAHVRSIVTRAIRVQIHVHLDDIVVAWIFHARHHLVMHHGNSQLEHCILLEQ